MKNNRNTIKVGTHEVVVPSYLKRTAPRPPAPPPHTNVSVKRVETKRVEPKRPAPHHTDTKCPPQRPAEPPRPHPAPAVHKPVPPPRNHSDALSPKRPSPARPVPTHRPLTVHTTVVTKRPAPASAPQHPPPRPSPRRITSAPSPRKEAPPPEPVLSVIPPQEPVLLPELPLSPVPPARAGDAAKPASLVSKSALFTNGAKPRRSSITTIRPLGEPSRVVTVQQLPALEHFGPIPETPDDAITPEERQEIERLSTLRKTSRQVCVPKAFLPKPTLWEKV